MRWKSICLFALVVAAGGCRHAPKGESAGSSSFALVEPRPSAPPQLSSKDLIQPASREDYRDAEAVHPLVMPVYPRNALAAKVGAVMVGVRVSVDAHGAVSDVRPSLLAVSILPSKFAKDFHEAVETAVRQWKFKPARIHHLETAIQNGFTYERVTRIETTEAEFDLSFTFSPSGKVETGAAAE